MIRKNKKLFLLACIVIPFLVYSFYYYAMVFKNAPYKFTEFESIVFKYGKNDSLINQYNSATGDYQYKTDKGNLVKKKLYLTKDEELYLHHKAAELGFWDFPSNEARTDSANAKIHPSPKYYMEFNYKRKSKKVFYDAAYDGDQRLVDANERMIKEIQKVLDEAEAKQNK